MTNTNRKAARFRGDGDLSAGGGCAEPCQWYQACYTTPSGPQCEMQSTVMVILTFTLFGATFLACMSVRRLLMIREEKEDRRRLRRLNSERRERRESLRRSLQKEDITR